MGANNNSPCAINNVPLIFNILHCMEGTKRVLEICMHSTHGCAFLGIPDRPFYHVVRRMGSSGNNKIVIFALFNPPNDARRVALHSAAHCLWAPPTTQLVELITYYESRVSLVLTATFSTFSIFPNKLY